LTVTSQAEEYFCAHEGSHRRCGERLRRNGNGLVSNALFAVGYIQPDVVCKCSALAAVEARDTKLEPDLQPIRTLKDVDMICHLWQQYTNVALLPLANTSVTVRREMSIFNNQTLSRVEGGANGMLQRVADGTFRNTTSLIEAILITRCPTAIISWLAAQLAKQKRNDFKPRNDDLSFSRVNTEPCEACCDLLEKVRDVAKESLSGKNLEVFLTSIGVTFHTWVNELSRICMTELCLISHSQHVVGSPQEIPR
jgi:hypothetical protein